MQFEHVIFSIGASHPPRAPRAPTPEPAAAAPPRRSHRSVGVPGGALGPRRRPEAASRPRFRLLQCSAAPGRPQNALFLKNGLHL